jgi:hypothetical protein
VTGGGHWGPGPRKPSAHELTEQPPPAPAPDPAAAAGSVYGTVIADLLKAEDQRKSSFEQRGIAIITTSGVLVSLVFALGTAVTSADAFTVSAFSRALLVAALVLFVTAAVAGIVANYPVHYELIAQADLRRLVSPEVWDGDAGTAARRVAEVSVTVLERARRNNQLKGRALLVGMVAEIAAVAAVAASVAAVLISD